MMSKAEKALILAKDQYGSRKRKAAITHALNKRLAFHILRQQKKEGGVYSCDLNSCYNRIIHAFTVLAIKRAGVTESVTVCMFETIQKLKHQVRIVFGDSEELWRERMEGSSLINGCRIRKWSGSSYIGNH